MADYWARRMLADGGEVDLINNRDYWVYRAAEARLIGSLCEDAISQDIMERLAQYYDELAIRSEAQD
jgi:hypothetical protein